MSAIKVPKNAKLRYGAHNIDFVVIMKGKVSITVYDHSKWHYEKGYTKSFERVIRDNIVRYGGYTYDITEAMPSIHKIA